MGSRGSAPWRSLEDALEWPPGLLVRLLNRGRQSRHTAAASAVRVRLGKPGVDVLVEAEQVGRIEFSLQGDEASQVPAEGSTDEPWVFPEAREVQVRLASAESLHSGVEVARPGDVALGLLGFNPIGQDFKEEGRLALANRSRI